MIKNRKTLKNKSSYNLGGKLWIEHDGVKFFGPGPMELLENIEKTGSLNQAAKEMKMSYKKAWEIINTLNAQAEKPIVILQSGGENGGGSLLTAEAKQLISYHKKLRRKFTKFLEREGEKLNTLFLSKT